MDADTSWRQILLSCHPHVQTPGRAIYDKCCTRRAPFLMDPNHRGHQATAIVSAFNRWRLEHALVAIRVRDALNNRVPEAVLRPLVEEARGQLWALFAMKKVEAEVLLWTGCIVLKRLKAL